MKFILKIIDETGHSTSLNIERSEAGNSTLNDFILDALLVSDRKRTLPLLVQCPNGEFTMPSLKQKINEEWEVEGMIVSWRD